VTPSPNPVLKSTRTAPKKPHRTISTTTTLRAAATCLGCSSAAYLPPEFSVTPAELAAQIHYDALTASLSGRALLPEPDPPRPATLS
jgi:hypothetical protein